MKNLFKILAALSLVAILMSCDITIVDNSSDSGTEINVYNYTGENINNLYIITETYYNYYVSNSSFDTIEDDHDDQLDGTISPSESFDIDTSEISLVGYYIIIEDDHDEYYAEKVTNDNGSLYYYSTDSVGDY